MLLLLLYHYCLCLFNTLLKSKQMFFFVIFFIAFANDFAPSSPILLFTKELNEYLHRSIISNECDFSNAAANAFPPNGPILFFPCFNNKLYTNLASLKSCWREVYWTNRLYSHLLYYSNQHLSPLYSHISSIY